MHRTLRLVARLATTTLLAAALIAVPAVVLHVVGVPFPGLTQLRSAWTTQRIDEDLVLRIGATVFSLLWVWFAATALAELWRVLAWRRAGGTARLAPLPPGPSGWVRAVVRFAAVSSVTAGALLSSVAGTARGVPTAAAATRPAAVVEAGAPAARSAAHTAHTAHTAVGAVGAVHVADGRQTPYSLARTLGAPEWRQQIIDLNTGRPGPDGAPWAGGVFPAGMEVVLPGEATVMTPLGPAHEVVEGDCYWNLADAHLREVTDHEPTPREVLEYTERLVGTNAPLLGHRDPTLIVPGELVVLPVVAEAPAQPPTGAPADTGPAAPEDVPVGAPADEPAGAPAPLPAEVPDEVPARAPTDLPAAPADIPAFPAGTPEVEPAAAPVAVLHEPANALTPFLAGAASATLLCAGGLGLLDGRRRRRLRQAPLGARPAAPVTELAAAETVLRSVGAAERAARLDMALRAAAADLAEQGAMVTVAILHHDGGVRLHLRGAATPAGGWWRLDPHAGTWLLPASVGTDVLGETARHGTHPSPALVHLGTTDDGDCFVDLEAIGLLSVESPHAVPLLRAIAATLELSPFLTESRVASVGIDLPERPDGRVDRLDSLDAALDAAASSVGSTPAHARHRSTFALRVAGVGGEAWEPAVIVAAGDHPASALVALEHAAQPGRGIAAAVEGPVPGSTWRLRHHGDRHLLEPLALEVRPAGVEPVELAVIRDLLAEADRPLDIDPGHGLRRPTPATPNPAFEEPDWSLLIRLYGRVEVVDGAGVAAAFERSKALELAAWLGQHRERPTRSAARTALWDVEVRDATFANVVSDARRGLARAVPPPEGEEWIGRTLTEELPLHTGVQCDAELVARRLAHARALGAADAIGVLRPAVELLDGMPFAGTGYLWCDAEGLSSALALTAVDAAAELAAHSLTLGDVEGVFWATGQGLKVIPGHEELLALRMRAHARRGDLAGVRNEWEHYERALAAETFVVAEPSPKMVALRRELLAPSLAG
ncbi:MAG: hypothetical protein M9961_14795 [Ilumatobacteraceae bacterium]|nr:hypothetical protein [Ilumatobacteraceae bacterium]